MLDFAFGFWKTKLKREIVKAKTHNRKSKNLKLQQRRGKIEIISPFCASTFSGFRLSLIRVFFFASSQAGGWSRRWTLQPRCRHHCGFDPHVCQGFKAIVSFPGEKMARGKNYYRTPGMFYRICLFLTF
jgi:hypothetical protein